MNALPVTLAAEYRTWRTTRCPGRDRRCTACTWFCGLRGMRRCRHRDNPINWHTASPLAEYTRPLWALRRMSA